MDWQIISAALGSAVSLSILVGILVRFGLMPYLERHLIAPVNETRKQVTENHHSNPVPTVLDRIDDVAQQVAANTRLTADNATAMRTLARMFDGHLEQAETTTERFQAEVDRIWARLRKEDER